MDQKLHSTIDMALSTAICASFAIPQAGALVGGSIAGGQFAFNILFPPELVAYALPISKNDIDTAVVDLKKAMEDGEFRTHAANVAGFSDDYSAIWEGLQMKASNFTDTAWDYHVKTFNASTTDFFGNVDKDDKLMDAIKWVEDHASNNDTVGFYTLAASLLIAYHNTGLMWEYNNQMANYEKLKSEYEAYLSIYEYWDASPPASRGMPPATVMEPAMPTKMEITQLSSLHAVRLHKDVLPRVIGYVSKFSTAWRTGWDGRKSQIETKKKEHFGSETDKSKQMELKLEWGSIYAFLWDDLTSQFGLKGVQSEGDVKSVGEILARWKGIQADLATSFK